jgi:hypothetical protein
MYRKWQGSRGSCITEPERSINIIKNQTILKNPHYLIDTGSGMNTPASCKNFIDRDMADVPKRLYRRYLKVSEATFQALLKNHSTGDVHHYKLILNFSSPYKGFEGCQPCLFCNT